MRKPTAARKKRTFGPSINKKRKRRTKWTFSFSFLLAAVDRLLPHELHFPCLFLDRSIVSVCPLQELFLSFRRTNSKLTMSRTVIKEKIKENVFLEGSSVISRWRINHSSNRRFSIKGWTHFSFLSTFNLRENRL